MLIRSPEPEFVNLCKAQESIPSLAGRYDSPFGRTSPPGYTGWRNGLIGIDSWAS